MRSKYILVILPDGEDIQHEKMEYETASPQCQNGFGNASVIRKSTDYDLLKK